MLHIIGVRKNPVLTMAQLAAKTEGKTVLIVPEQLSHEAERTLSRVGDAVICRKAEVLSFTRLAQRVASVYGGAARKSLDGAGRILAMSLAVEELRAEIKYFAASGTRPEFLKELVQVVDELKAACVQPERLLSYAEAQSGMTAQKFRELGLILKSYDAVCANTSYDPRDQLTHLAQLLDRVEYAAGMHFILGGFQDFTAQQLRIVEALLLGGAQVTVLLCDDLQESTSTCFEASRRVTRQLRAIATRVGKECRMRCVEPDFFPEQAHLLDHLYGGALWPWEGECEKLSLFCAESVEQECRMASERIYTMVQQGARYRDFAVVLCSDGAHRKILEPMLDRLNIPHFSAGRAEVSLRPLPTLVLSALEAVAYGYRRESIVDHLRSGLTGLSDEEADELENYAIAWNIRGGKWLRTWIDHPDGYDARMDDAARQRLDHLNELRRRVMDPLQQLELSLRRARSLQEQTKALFDCVCAIGVTDQLEQLIISLEQSGHAQTAQEEMQMYSIFVGALEQMYHLSAAAARSNEDFYRLVKLLLEQYEVSTIPAGVDQVTIGSIDSLRGRSCRHLLILGASEGAFPSYTPEQSLITEEERELLFAGGIELPLLQQVLDRGILSIYNVLSCAGESLYLSCATGTGEPSYLFSRICSRFPKAEIKTPDVWLSEHGSYSNCAALALSGGSELPAGLSAPVAERLTDALIALRERSSYTPGQLDADAVHALYGQTLRLSPSRIDRLAGCRCGYYLEYGLKLSERKEFRFDAPVFGTFVHDVLENTVRDAEQLGGFRCLSDGQLEELAEVNIARFTKEYMNDMQGKDERFRYLYHRNRSEVLAILRSLARELRLSAFRPAAFELRFAPGGDLPPVQIPDTSVPAQIIGVVDRADLFETDNATYLRIVDYKTGRKSLDYTDLSIGVGLQMLIYLFSLKKSGLPGVDGRLQPAGVLYVPAREPILSASERPDDETLAKLRIKENRRNGLVSDDTLILSAMEETDGDPEFLPYKNGKTGRKGDLATMRQWGLLENHVQKSLQDLVEQIAGGDVSPNPYSRGNHNSCSWCAYEPVCRFSSGGGCMRSYEKISAGEFWAELERKDDHG